MNDQTLLYICIGGTVSLIAFFVSRVAVGNKDEKLRARLANSMRDTHQGGEKSEPVVPLLQRIGSAAASPFMPKSREKVSTMRRDLGYAGVYSTSAAKIMQGFKFIFLLGGLLAGYFTGITVTAGAAWGRDGSGLVRDQVTGYVRVGRAF